MRFLAFVTVAQGEYDAEAQSAPDYEFDQRIAR
jgi:hypothetical protein